MLENLKQVHDVYWTNSECTRVSCFMEYNDGVVEQLSVGRDDNSPFWQAVMNAVTIEQIDETTAKIKAESAQQRKLSKFQSEEREGQRKHNALFNAKIEAFDIAAVANASTARKSKIRKAKNVSEVVAQIAVCIMESEQQSNG